VLDRQFLTSLQTSEASKPSVLALWFFPIKVPLQPITKEEEEWANQLPTKRSKEYRHSRGYVRAALSEIWQVPALEIPLHSFPGKPPTLKEGWGNVSFSHCCDGLLIGWSPKRLGVDLERADRSFKADQLAKRYFTENEKAALCNLNKAKQRSAVLQSWVIKEAAIKWQRGNLAEDISQWSHCRHSNKAFHHSLGYQIGLHSFHYYDWYIAVAFDANFHNHSPIVCNSFRWQIPNPGQPKDIKG